MTRSPERLIDDTLVSNAATGSELAFRALHARWHPRLLRHAYRLLSEPDLARDAVQESWMDIVRGLRNLNDYGAFQVWAFRIVSRRCAKTIRSLRKHRHIEQALSQEKMTAEAMVDEAGPDDELAAVRRALSLLADPHRIVTELFYLEELGVAEIAVALDLPLGTVKTRLMHARKYLRIHLQGDDHDT